MWKNIRQFLPKIIYRHRLLRELIDLPGAKRFLNRLYSRWSEPSEGILQLEVWGKSAKFYISSRAFGKYLKNYLKAVGAEGSLLGILIQMLKPGDCFYDIGAEIGFYTIFLAQIVGKQGQIIAFEPEEMRYELLQENLKLNNSSNVRSFRLALSDHGGESELLLGGIGIAPTLIDVPRSRNDYPRTQRVKIVKGDEFIAQANLPLPRALKIDVEGYEHYVLLGLEKTLKSEICQIICCEIHPKMLPPNIKPKMILELLKSYGFCQIKIYPRGNQFHALATKSSL